VFGGKDDDTDDDDSDNSIHFFIINLLGQEPYGQLHRQHRRIRENTADKTQPKAHVTEITNHIWQTNNMNNIKWLTPWNSSSEKLR